MKKLIIGGAAIAILGYLGVVGYLHQFDKENATQLLMENHYTGEQEKVALLNWIREARKMSLLKETPNVDADRLVQPIPDSIATCNR